MANPPDHRDAIIMTNSRTFSVRKWLLIGLPVALMLLATSTGYWLLRSHAGANWVWGQVENASGGALRAADIEGDFASGFVIHQLVFESETVDLSVGLLEIQAGPGWWPLALEVRNLLAADVLITNKAVEPGAQSLSTDTDIAAVLSYLNLPLPLKIRQAVINNIMLQQGDQTAQLMAHSIEIQAALNQQLVITRLDLRAAEVSAKLSGHLQLQTPFNLAARLEGDFEIGDTAGFDLKLPFKLSVQGQIDDWAFELDTTINSGQSHSSRLAAFGTGSSQAIDLQKVSLDGQGVDLDIQGKLDWSLTPEADIKAEITKLDLSPWLSEWPVGSSIEGGLEMSWSQSGLVIPVCDLAVSGTELGIELTADLDIEANDISASIKWVNLDWPLAQENPVFSSPSGLLTLAGGLEEWVASGQLGMHLGDYPQANIDIRADGGRNHAHLVVPSGQVLGGSMSGEAEFDWTDEFSWAATINAEQVNPVAVLPEWPGLLDANLEITADGRENTTEIVLRNLDGLLRGIAVNAHGVFIIEADEVSFKNVQASTDKVVLLVDGRMSDSAGLRLRLNGELPSTLLWGASGTVEAQARYSRHVDKPLLELNMDATGVSWADVILDEVSLRLQPDGEKHGLSVNIVKDDMAFSSEVMLVPEITDRPLSGKWSAEFEQITLAIDQSYIFTMPEPALLEWSSEATVLQGLCLTETAGAKFCLSGSYEANHDSALSVDVTAAPLNYLRNIFDLDIQFGQSLEGSLQWQQSAGKAPTGGADFRITAGEIIDLEDQQVLTETSEGRFAFALQNGNLESGTFDLEFPGTGFIDVDFEVMDIADSEARNLTGRAFAQMEDIAVLGQLALPGLDEISGRFESTIQLGGTLEDPTLDGGFKLSSGLIEYAPVGLLLEDIEFEGQLDKLDHGSLSGKFRAGEGLGSINGQILFKDFENIQLDVELSGEQLLLTNTEQLRLRTDTDINFALSPGRIDIDGHIKVPSARFSPSNLLLEVVSDSPDLIIEPIEGQAKQLVEKDDSSNRVYGSLELTFGDDVLIEVPGVETSLEGSVIFSWSGEPLPLAQGSYHLNGSVDVYGPVLQIDNGNVSFPDIAADNPVLNIRAEREIYGNTQIRSAGVQVVGTLKRPVIEAYTVPATNEDRAWTLLVTGTDFDQGQGVSGFDVGTYIAPKLYVSYGISLFDDDNVVSARYDLKKGFGIKVSSGQRETGLDATYTIDR